MSTLKPSRSDEISDPEQQIKNSNQIRADFYSLAPKRATKPTRSEPEPLGSFSTSDKTNDHPEADKFQSLQSQTHANILGEGNSSSTVQEEFSETEYYTNLTAIDKQHHTTGSGFINVGKEGEGEEGLIASEIGDGGEKVVYRSNPATNEWIPAEEEGIVVSDLKSKPNRSESA